MASRFWLTTMAPPPPPPPPIIHKTYAFLLAALPSPWEPDRTLQQWTAVLVVAATVFAFQFIRRGQPDAIKKERERRRDLLKRRMCALHEYVKAEEAKPEGKRKAPEASRVKELLWDHVHTCRTTATLNAAEDGEMLERTEKLYKELAVAEYEKVCDLTRRARMTDEMKTASKDDLKKLVAHESGEKLLQAIKKDDEVRKTLGREFSVPRDLRDKAIALKKQVRADQSKNARRLVKMMLPSLPYVLASTCISMLHTMLRSKFHQIGLWVQCIEAGVAGKEDAALSLLFSIWVGHMLIKLIELPEFGYTKRAKAKFGNAIRNGVLQAMVRQDYEYFDRNPAGVLQDRLNRDANELGENLIDFPRHLVNRTIWVLANMYQVFHATPTPFFAAACGPVLLMTTFQYFTFHYFRRMNERARRIEEDGVSATAEVLRQIKTVRQFASERRASANYARRNLARELIGEAVSTFKRAMEVIVWCVFDSGICVTIILGLPYVRSGELSASQLIDAFCKLNFNVNFCLREILESIPRAAHLLEPMGRICDLLHASPTIEPAAHPSYVDVRDASELATLLGGCEVLQTAAADGVPRIRLGSSGGGGDEVGMRQLFDATAAAAVADAGEDGDAAAAAVAPKRGAELICLSAADHRFVSPYELVVEGEEEEEGQGQAHGQGRVGQIVAPRGLSFPVRATFSDKFRPTRFQGRIEFDDVHFVYPTDLRKPVLQGISFVVEPGEKVALVGPTGCGKSSCMSLLQRLYDPTQGEIRLDGIPLPQLDVQHMRSRVVIVDQHTVLFSSTIRENLCYGLERDVSDAEIIEACVEAKAWEFIKEKPDKLMTYLEGGATLSGGQRQRLAIARAIIRKPDVILLDEATSALDNENEAKVQKALDELARKGSALVIAHRLSTIQDSDKIVVVDHGKAVEIGTHDELLGKIHAAVTEKGLTPLSLPGENGADRPSTPPSAASCSRSSSRDSVRSFAATEIAEEETAVAAEASEPELFLPLMPRRIKTSPSNLTPCTSVEATQTATYRRLWDAATGNSEKLSLNSMQKRIAKLDEELQDLKTRRASMVRSKEELLVGVEPPTTMP